MSESSLDNDAELLLDSVVQHEPMDLEDFDLEEDEHSSILESGVILTDDPVLNSTEFSDVSSDPDAMTEFEMAAMESTESITAPELTVVEDGPEADTAFNVETSDETRLLEDASEPEMTTASETTTEAPDTKIEVEVEENWFFKMVHDFFTEEDETEMSAEACRDRGIELAKVGRYHRAAHMLERSLYLGDDDLTGGLWLGQIHISEGNLERAIAVLTELQGEHANDPGVCTLLGKALLFSSRYSDAIEVMQPIATANPDRFNLHFFLGLAYAKMENYGKAVDAWVVAAKLRPDHAETREFLDRALGALAKA
ncbi:MAG: tetratricopeptide repeat protein [Magnetococcales bacterium]|nr:tetratricopeptide repeat protein [Magnetococcales bacterium]